jgi:hypothetical protein
MVTVKIEFEVSEEKLMRDFMGCNWEQDPVARGFIHSYEYALGDSEFIVTYEDENNDYGLNTTSLTVQDIADGWAKAISSGAYHCGEAIGLDSEDWDACVGTAILQYAIYGEELYA